MKVAHNLDAASAELKKQVRLAAGRHVAMLRIASLVFMAMVSQAFNSLRQHVVNMTLSRYGPRYGLVGVVMAVVLGLSLSSSHAQKQRSYILATASTGGTFYPVGVALATLTKLKLAKTHNVSLSAINSAGSAENVRLLMKGEVQFGLVQGLYGADAWAGRGTVAALGPQKNLRSISTLWQNVEHFVVDQSYVKTGTVDDLKQLKGKTLAFGKKNSGTLGSNAYLLRNLGLDLVKDFRLMHGGYGPSARALQDGKVVGLSTPAGVPINAIVQLHAARKGGVKILSFTPEQLKKADGGLNLWSSYEIPANTYPGQKDAVVTIAQPNFLAVNADVPEEDVYQVTKAMYENLTFLQAIHKATKSMALERAMKNLPVPLHPGAARFYREKGLQIPDNLILK